MKKEYRVILWVVMIGSMFGKGLFIDSVFYVSAALILVDLMRPIKNK